MATPFNKGGPKSGCRGGMETLHYEIVIITLRLKLGDGEGTAQTKILRGAGAS